MADPLTTVRSALEALERNREAFVEYVAPDFEGVISPDVSAEPDTYRGPDGVRRYFELFDDVVDGLVFHPGELTVEEGWVVADVRVTGSGQASGVPMEMTVVMTAQVTQGKIARLVAYPDRAAARSGISANAST
jgi:ketosteroid isomerase-like protein